MVQDQHKPPPLEYGRSPSLREKIDRYLGEVRGQGVGEWTAAPPLTRLLWWLKLDVPPPVFCSFTANALFFGVTFGFLISLVSVFAFGEEWRRQLISVPIAAVIFGLGMAWVIRRQARRLKLSPWNGHPPGG